MRKLLRILLLKPVLWAASKFSSRPDKERIFNALTKLSGDIMENSGKRGLVVPFEQHSGKFILFSDQHKGGRNGADDFLQAESNYLSALEYYHNEDYCFINLGDSEELWENSIRKVQKKNKLTFEAEKKFLDHNRYIKLFGNHDLYWANSPWAGWHLKAMYGEKIKIYEGVILPVTVGDKDLKIFCTHGHQGDGQSDGNWFSKFFVANIWAPLQALLRINPNTPAYDAEKKTLHNSLMYEWVSCQNDMILITGHTHQPVFESLTHLERLYKQLQFAEQEKNPDKINSIRQEIIQREKDFTSVSLDYMRMRPSYFNTGCCCFDDGDITGIEIADGCIRLIKWTKKGNGSYRLVLEERKLEELIIQFGSDKKQ